MMLSDILDHIIGCYEVDSGEGEALLNYMKACDIDFRRLTRSSDGRLHFRVTHSGARRLRKTDFEINMRLIGLPAVIFRYRKRPGILVGVLLFIVLLRISDNFIWDIRVEGNTSIPESEVMEILSEFGCTPGALISSIDFYKMSNGIVERSDKISWISVNMEGTLARVVLRETKKERAAVDETPANIVATRDGYIRSVTASRGRAVARYDKQVKCGDLLISGVIEEKDGGVRLERAEGIVLAETKHSFSVEIPFEFESYAQTGAAQIEKILKIFGKVIKLSQNSGILYKEYDTIESEGRIVLFGEIELPVIVSTKEYREYEAVARRLTLAEARERAIHELSLKISELDGAELLWSSTTERTDDEKYTLTCEMILLEDIGEIREIGISGLADTK